MATPIPENRVSFSLSNIAEATGGAIQGDPDAVIHGVCTDSRRIDRGMLYVALIGELHDGHAYASRAVEAGAAALMVSEAAVREGRLQAIDVPLVVVADTTMALGDLAHAHRRRWGGPVICVTGSAGKTSTKELLAGALSGTGLRVLRTHGNLNNHIGLPMMTFLLDETVDVAVFEIGTSGRGEIARLTEIAEPQLGVVTCVSAAHTAGLADVQTVGIEKTDLPRGLLPLAPQPSSALAKVRDGALAPISVTLFDDTVLQGAMADVTAARVTFGEAEGADFRVVERGTLPDLVSEVRVADTRGEQGDSGPGDASPWTARIAALGPTSALNVAAVCAVVEILGLDMARALEGMGRVPPTEGRMRPVPVNDHVLLLDDAYNANPRSVAMSLQTLGEVAQRLGRSAFAVLGDMGELGHLSESAHRDVMLDAAQRVDHLFAVGPAMSAATSAAPEQLKVTCATDALASIPCVMDAVVSASNGAVVLVKGSRSMGMERVLQELLAKLPSDAHSAGHVEERR